MKKKIIIIVLGASIFANVVGFINNKTLTNSMNQLINHTESIKQEQETTKTELNSLKEEYDKLLKDAQQIEDEKEKLQQEVENLRALREKANQELALSRGLSNTTYRTGSRVDVKTGITAKLLNKAFVGTKMEGLGQAFVDAEQKYEVNAIFLAAIGALESGWGEKDLGKNNLFGYNANDGAVHLASRFSSKAQGIGVVAKALRENYLTPGGEYYNGATITGVNIKYCSSSEWKTQIADIMNRIISRATK